MPLDVAGVEVVEEAHVPRHPGQEYEDVQDEAGQQLGLVTGGKRYDRISLDPKIDRK